MLSFSTLEHSYDDTELEVSRYTDLVVSSDGLTVYATNRYDGALHAFAAAGVLTRIASSFHAGPPTAGADPSLTFLNGDILSGGGASGQLILHDLSSGGFVGSTALGASTVFAGALLETTVVDLTGGQNMAYSGIAGHSGLAAIRFDSSANVSATWTQPDTSTAFLDGTHSITSGQVLGATFIASASAAENGITLWRVEPSGTLLEQASMAPGNGFWADAPADIEWITIGSRSFLVVAGSNSSSLSVIEAFSDGSFMVRDHVIDDQNTRFANATEIATVSHGGRDYVFVSGSDDGISAFYLSGDGQLIEVGTIQDTQASGLANISALAAQSDGDGIDVFATSSIEIGVTRLRLHTGNAGLILASASLGETLTGSADADTIKGGTGSDEIFGLDGHDILFDGAGSDTMSGGAGRDIFVLSSDDGFDHISDFTLGEDKIDLSAWAGLRSLNQLFSTTLSNGIRLTYGDETLEILSSSGQSLQLEYFAETDLLGPARLPETISPGLSGPVTAPPDLPVREPYDPPTQPPPPPEDGGVQIIGTSEKDMLTGGYFGDAIYGLSNDDTLRGGDGADFMNGGSGSDYLQGEAGDDTLYGGTSRDLDWTNTDKLSATNDVLIGGEGDDILFGQSGADTLSGGVGNDILTGGAGRDVFQFSDGRDIITDFALDVDRIELDHALWLGSLTADQVLNQFSQSFDASVALDFGSGNRLVIQGITELEDLAVSIDFI